MKSGLDELKNFVMVKGDLQPDVWRNIEKLLGQIVHACRGIIEKDKMIEH